MTTYAPDDWQAHDCVWGTDMDLEEDVQGEITAFADAGGGQVTVTSASHSVIEDMYVRIENTTNYDGEYVATNIAANTFEITHSWDGDDATGDWFTNNIGDSMVVWTNTQPASTPQLLTKNSKKLAVEEGEVYEVFAIVQGTETTEAIYLYHHWYDSEENYVSGSTTGEDPTTSGVWYKRSKVATAPAGARYLRVSVAKEKTNAWQIACDFIGVRKVPIGFSAYLNSDTSYAIGAAIVFDVENFDYGSCYNTSNGRFTAPFDGVYTFNARARLVDLNAGNYVNLQLEVNGTAVGGGQRSYCHANGDDPVVTLSKTILLTRGDYVEISTVHDYGANRTVSGLSGSYQYTTFEGYRVE